MDVPAEDGADPLDDFDVDLPLFLNLALAVAAGMLAKPRLSMEELRAVGRAFAQSDDRTGGLQRIAPDEEQFDVLSKKHPDVRLWFLREADHILQRRFPEPRPDIYRIHCYFPAWQPSPVDFELLLQSLQREPSPQERIRMATWLVQLWQWLGCNSARFAQLKRVACQFPECNDIANTPLRRISFRLARFWHQRCAKHYYKLKRLVTRQRIRRAWNRARYRIDLLRYRRQLAEGKFAGALADLIMEASNRGEHYVPNDLSEVIAKRGKGVARALRAGCKNFWRSYSPPLPHEREDPSAQTRGSIAGLAGISFAWTDGELQFAQFSAVEVERAMRYALNELNGVPPWTEELARVHPEAVKRVLCQCVDAEWVEDAKSTSHLATHKIIWSKSSFLAGLVAEQIEKRLRSTEPKSAVVLEGWLCLLPAYSPAPSVQFKRMVERYSWRAQFDAPAFIIWTVLWLQIDPLKAIRRLDHRVAGDKRGKKALIQVFARLSGRGMERLPLVSEAAFLHSAAFSPFFLFVHRYVHPKSDLVHAGAHSITSRDEAQQFRGSLLERFIAANDSGILEVLQGLTAARVLRPQRDYIRHLIDKHIQSLAEPDRWLPQEVRTFSESYERQPRSAADLFQLLTRRLDDLTEWVEYGDDSPREEVRKTDGETAFRRWLARRLRDRANGRYVVPEEWEIDAMERPDLRILTCESAPISVELKIADNWSLDELLQGLESQLIGKYLRDHRARYGVYVLAQFNRTRKWKGPCGQWFVSDDVLKHLRARATEILATRDDVSEVAVFRIHFSRG